MKAYGDLWPLLRELRRLPAKIVVYIMGGILSKREDRPAVFVFGDYIRPGGDGTEFTKATMQVIG